MISDYKIDWAKGYGLADTIKGTAVTTETMFSAGSISKFLAAVAALKMVDDEQIDLDRPINDYLTSWKLAENDFTKATPVTLRMLLSHSGSTSQSAYFGFTPTQPLPTVVEVLSGAPISETRPVVVNSAPNQQFSYSGGGYMVAQLALMDVSGLSFSELTRKLLFTPLGMENSTFEQPVPASFAGQCAWAYSSLPWFKGMPYVYPQQAAAGLYTTPTDLAKFFIDVQESYRGTGTVLTQATTTAMLTPQQDVSDGAYREQIGIGPFLLQRTDNRDPGGVYFEFTGVNAGFLAYGIASVTDGNGVIVMLNSGDDVNGLGKEIRRAVAKAYNWTNFLPAEIEPISLEDTQLDEYAGRYRMSADEVLYLRRENGYLVENINEGSDIYCFPIGGDTIVLTDYNIKAGFARNDRGEVISLQNTFQDTPMLKMRDDEFSPSEYLQKRDYGAAKSAFAALNLNEYQITYVAYDLLNKKPFDAEAARAVLEVAWEQHPRSSIVYSRYGDYYQKLGNTANAIASYEKAVEIDPSDQSSRDALNALQR